MTHHTITDEQIKKVRNAIKKAIPFIYFDDNGAPVKTRYLLEAVDRLQESLAILDAVEKQTESAWLPIETAPRDGEMFLATRPDWMTPNIVFWRHKDAFFGTVGSNAKFIYTHWMPLPSPPEATPEQQSEAELLEGKHTS